MNLEEEEKSKDLNLLTPLMNIINSILSLRQKNVFKSNNNNNSNENNANNNNILFSIDDDIKYCFKVLILDDSTFKFISPLLKQSSLKKNNICLTTKLKCQKDKIDDVMAIYLITPTPTNFKLIIDDMKANIYKNYSINFVEKPDDNLLEEFLSNIIKLDKYKKIFNLHVFPIKYSLLHPKVIDFCSLDNKIIKPYTLFNLNLNNKETENYYDLIANMLFNCLFCMRISPLVKYRKGSYCELIVNKIQNKFISIFNKFPKLKKEFQNGNCLMILLERDLLDLPIMFHHPSGFGAMINDICGLTFDQQQNKTFFINNNSNRKFNLDPLNDFIWNKSLIKPYHEVGDETLLKYKKYIQEMEIFEKDNKNPNNLEELANKSEKLAESIKIIDTKKMQGDILDKHANFYPILNKNIEQRHLAEIHLIERDLLDRREINKEINDKITSMINENKINKDNYLDIFRLCLIYLLIDKDFSNDKFIKDVINRVSLSSPYNAKAIVEFFDIRKKGTIEHSSKDLLSKYDEQNKSKTLLSQVGGVAGGLFKKGFNLIKNTVSNLTYYNRTSIAMEILYDLYYNKNRDSSEFSRYQLNEDIYTPIKSSLYQNIFLFTLGGGSLNEFEYCCEYMDKLRIKFIYGADKIYSPTEFLGEINELAIKNMNTTTN
jgi:hypothetical protein